MFHHVSVASQGLKHRIIQPLSEPGPFIQREGLPVQLLRLRVAVSLSPNRVRRNNLIKKDHIGGVLFPLKPPTSPKGSQLHSIE